MSEKPTGLNPCIHGNDPELCPHTHPVSSDAYNISLATPRDLTGTEVAMHVFAQTTRFVIRKQMTPKEAAELAVEMGVAFVNALSEHEPPKEGVEG